MATPITIAFLFSTVLVYLSCRQCTAARDSISSGTSIGAENQETLVSSGKIFQMGFFKPKRNQNDGFTYFGIWYYMDPSTVVWVANRDSPIPGSSTPVLTVEHDGNLVVKNKDKTYFTTGLRSSSGSRTVRLLDTGNAILADDHTGAWAWQSFRYPTDTFLPGMFLDKKMTLTSWKSQEDPGTGDFVFQQDQVFGYNNYTIFTGKNLHWKSGFGLESTNDSIKMFTPAVQLLSNSSVTPYTRLLMKSSGEIQYHSWDSSSRKWVLNWSQPKDFCSIYNACGPNSSCNISKNVDKDSSCKCFPGFELANDANQSEQKCKRTSTICSGDDNTFLKMMIVKIDVTFETFLEATSEVECKEKCLGLDCCQAYSYNGATNEKLRRAGAPGGRQGCWIWNAVSQFVDVQVGDPGSTGHIVAFRYSNSTGLVTTTQSNGHSGKSRSSSSTRRILVVLGFVIPGVLLLCFISFICYRRVYVRKRKGNEESNSIIEFAESVRQVQDLLDPLRTNENDSQAIGIPFFDFERISAATDGFSDANKLGEGGFGPVYKGMFPGGVKIAVKRLSVHSGQGLEEFKNEVTLIAKLQHRNLVRLLGYCMRGNEKMLIYEYMPHKSLDAFIFDRTQSVLLDWPKRFDIILGISRGIIYLHQDSRLRIIHRDLKPSNILLDEDLNPKISDFGLAKIVNGNEVESNTKRVIGTYGYMAPEYALEGLFSVKSDVYSFGVVLLEIISGKKKHHQSEQSWSLINYAWHLWKEEKPLELIEPVLSETYDHNEVLRCIVVGLLCVQEDPDDRPNMSNVFMMLTSDMGSLPKPNQPAFIARRLTSGSYSSSSDRQQTLTNVDLTISVVQGR